jgi:hypothetical protein
MLDALGPPRLITGVGRRAVHGRVTTIINEEPAPGSALDSHWAAHTILSSALVTGGLAATGA